MSRSKLLLNTVFALLFLALLAAVGTYVASSWRAGSSTDVAEPDTPPPAVADGNTPVRLSPEARKNMELTAEAVQPTRYFQRIEIPGVITDRPGVSDRSVNAPVAGFVTDIHGYPGSMVPPGGPLFTLRIVSDTIHTSQLELFKATKEIEIAQQQRRRLAGLAEAGGIAQSRIIEFDNQIARMEVNVEAYRQDLGARGLSADQIDAAADGDFVTQLVISAPAEQASPNPNVGVPSETSAGPPALPFNFEVQSLKVELGQQVAAGELLATLADHRSLLIEGRGFKTDLWRIQQAASSGFPVGVTFEAAAGPSWPPPPSELRISHVANTIDFETRTFAFFLPLQNQWQTYEQDGVDRLLWRFRPGDRVRLAVAVDELDNVFVLPQAAVVREGPEAFVFRQNGDLFDRIPVHVLHQDSTSIVVANDGKLRKGSYIAQNGAASLNRVLKAQLASGQPANLHVHPDGTVHAAH